MGITNFKIDEGLDSLDEAKLDDFFKVASTSSLFQTPLYHRFFASQSNVKALFFAITENKIPIVTLSCIIYAEPGIKRRFSSRAIIYGGPVIDTRSSSSNDALKLLLNHLKTHLSNEAIYIEFRNLNDYSAYKTIFYECGFNYQPYVNYHIAIADMEKTLAAFGRDKRTHIKKAFRLGVSIKKAEHAEEVKSLYQIMSDLYRHKVKKPLPDLVYFLNLFSFFRAEKCGFVALVIFDDEVIGGAFCLNDNTTVYDFYRCGLDERYRNFYPSVMAVYAGIRFASEIGLENYDFMGAGQMHIPYGVRDFKSRFGGELVEHGRFLSVLNKPLFYLGRAYIRFTYLFRTRGLKFKN